jgi:hypothetical protein
MVKYTLSHISTSTPITNKRSSPDNPDDLPATEKQEKRQIRRRNSISDLTDIIPKKAPSTVEVDICDRVYFTIVIVLFHNYIFSN